MAVRGIWVWRSGSIIAEHSSIWRGEPGSTLAVPVTWAMLDTDDGIWLIDSGFADEAATDPVRRYGAAGERVRLAPSETMENRLAEAGVEDGPVSGVLLTHLHYDHAGGLCHLPNGTPAYTTDVEIAAAKRYAGRRGYSAEDLKAPVQWRLFEGTQTPVDGVTLVPSPGHSAGHVSFLIDCGSTRYLYTGDAAPTVRSITERILPGLYVDNAASIESLDRLITASEGTIILPSHDPSFWGDEDLHRYVATY